MSRALRLLSYRREIDGLRAVAVVPVILFHAGMRGLSGGFLGVDIFFVLSGYLITSIIVVEIEQRSFSLSRFYERRARRILPALFVVLAATLPAAWIWLPPPDMKEFAESIAAVIAFGSNFFFWANTGYFATAADLKPLLHTWSLAVEEQYYAVFPFAILLLLRFGRKVVMTVLVVLGLSSLLLAQRWSALHPGAAFFLLPTRSWELLIGAATALILTSPTQVDRIAAMPLAMREGLAAGGLCTLGISLYVLNSTTPLPGVYGLPAMAATACIILFADATTITGRFLGNRLFVAVGLVSYSLYLWHQPILAFLRLGAAGDPGPLVTVVALASTVLLAVLTWRYVEVPVRDRRRVSARGAAAVGIVAGAFLLAFGVAGHSANGFADARIGEGQRKMVASMSTSPKRDTCLQMGDRVMPPAKACEFFGNDIRWAVIGDSHGLELSYALALRLKERGFGLKQLTMAGCHPAFGRTDDSSVCARWTKEAVAWIDEQSKIETVVVVYRIQAHLFGGHLLTYPAMRNEFEGRERERRWAAYVELLRHFVRSGKKVALVLQAPELGKDINELIFRHGERASDVVGVDRSWWNERNRFVEAHRSDVPSSVTVVDPAELFCDSKSCFATREGAALYYDDNHLSLGGADLVALDVLRGIDATK